MSLSRGSFAHSPKGVDMEWGKMFYVQLNSGPGAPGVGIFLIDYREQKTWWVAKGHLAFAVCFNSSKVPLFLAFWNCHTDELLSLHSL